MNPNVSNLKYRLRNNRLAKDSFWAILGNVLSKGLSLLAGIVVARFLGKEIYGEYGMIKNTLVSISIFSTFGLAYTTTKYIAEEKNKNQGVLNFIINYSRNITLLVSSIMAFFLFIGASYIADNILRAPYLEMPLKLVSIWVVFNAITSTQVGILAGFGEFKRMTQVNVYVGVTTFIFSILFVYYWQLIGALMALLLAQILNCYLNYRLISKANNSKVNVTFELNTIQVIKKKLINYSIPIALQEGVYSLSSWLISWFLILFAGYDELGIYSAAMQWAAIVLFIPGILRNVILSHFSETADDDAKFNKILKLTLLSNFISVFIPFVIIFLFSGIITSFYGDSFSGLSAVINLSVLAVIPMSLSNVYIQAFLSKAKNWLMFFLKLGMFCLTLILSFIFLKIGFTDSLALSVCIATLISNFIYLFILIILYKKCQIM